jgi:hypothetical protein
MTGVARCHLGYLFRYENRPDRAHAALRAGIAALEALPSDAWERTAIPKGA